jgi:acyl-CoA synthetase (AMP-forming)/AMP-acid ligase II
MGYAESQFESFPESALDGSIVDRFDATVRRFPSRLAISDAAQSLTYSELSSLIDRIAVAVDATVNKRPGPVAIFRPNDVLYAATTLGILAAGRGYVPMDADYPIERNRLIASHAGVAAVVTVDNLVDQVRSLVRQALNCGARDRRISLTSYIHQDRRASRRACIKITSAACTRFFSGQTPYISVATIGSLCFTLQALLMAPGLL